MPNFATMIRILAFTLSSCILLAACGREHAREPGLEWKNVPMEITSRVDKPTGEQVVAAGFPDLGGTPRRLLKARSGDEAEGGDTLTLLDFGDEATAYAAFQDVESNPEDFTEGFAVHEDRAYFRRGQWVGAMPIGSWRGITELVNALSLPGVPMGSPYALPDAFASLLHQGRVEGSERILTREFMGIPFEGRVYAVRLNCQGDTAWVFASAHLTREFGFRVGKALKGSLDSSTGELAVVAHSFTFSPLELRFSRAGMVGVEGCFDDSLTNFWIKMQTRGLKNVK